jgi:hypothetical protein
MRNAIRLFPLLFVTVAFVSAQTQLIGVSSVQSTLDSDTSGQAEAFQQTASTTGTVTAMSVFIDLSNRATTIVVGLYSDSYGHPKNLLGSGIISAPLAGQWNTVAISPGVSVVSGTSYHLAVLGTGGTIQYRDTGSGVHSETSYQRALTSLPATWSSGQSWPSSPLSAYGTGTTGGVNISISPTSVSLNEGAQQQFTATVTGTTNTAVNWSVKSGTGTINSFGLYTAPNAQETDTVQVQGKADTTKTASATVTVSSGVSISISPTSTTVKEGGTQQFTATVSGCGTNCGVNWSVPTGTGSVTQAGLFIAPNTPETDSVKAQVQADLTKTAMASVTVPAVAITISPTSVSVSPNGTQQFTATVTGTVNTGVTYSALTGTINASGMYTAPGATGSDTITVMASAAPNPQANASVTIQNQSQNACGNTLSWTSSTCQVPAVGRLNTAMVNGVNDPNAWTVISRHGEYGQNESECNGPWGVSVLSGALVIGASAQSRTCGDFNPVNGAQCSGAGSPCPGSFPYSTGDVQWNTFNFKYGVLITRQKVPAYQTSLWPGSGWLLTTTCQTNNKYTGDTGFDGCPSPGQSGYNEMDVDEFYNAPSGWPQFHIANPNWGCCGGYPSAPLDTNWHVFATVWTSSGVKQYLDGAMQFNTSSTINASLFYIFQTQTGGVGGTPKTSLLPANLYLDYIKVCSLNYTLAQCTNAATDGSDPNVIFWDDFGGPAQ